jgi:hypothetical protein
LNPIEKLDRSLKSNPSLEVAYLDVDYQTAHNLLITQGIDAGQTPDALINYLEQGNPPVPGQVTSVLLALKIVFESLKDAVVLDRELACSLHVLASESRRYFAAGQQAGVEWPPLLDEDLERISAGVASIFYGSWIDA